MAINFIAQQAGRIFAHANRFLVSELRRRGVTDIVPSHGDILNYLLRHDGATSTDIAVGSHRTKPTVTVLVDKLIAAGYVERRRSTKDRRETEVWLTDKGRALEPMFYEVSEALSEEIVRNLTPEETQTLELLLKKAAGA